ncbi:MAG: serine hydrolase [Gammaproteobacteria bacterium]|jgi:CubicO group peptidase (beta-lactamase class C family)|nr:serine hydrolase [Gammaproteobacteria bacterium]MBQ09294.1 serine hydrolase [Gammaproteobacteria bacterium]MDP6147287.1 serine hydrolase [Gammaproteobacteria bacterium]HJM99990.1 serine hydrolase [Gammaproteobacteria bacterium]|tara:strand:+ start:6317 stop:7489 length:1173 start_codon:yes stop_codon:yes gene_type:complete
MLFKLLKFILKALVCVIALISVYLGYLYSQSPTVMSRIASMMMGEATGELEIVEANETFVIDSGSPDNISKKSIEAAIQFSADMGSHALLIYQDDALILEKYFDGYDTQSISDTQSMHKTVLAMLVGIAIDDGIIGSVDEPASNYLTEWKNDSRNIITIKNLLQQSSGLDYPEFSFNPLSDFNQLMLGEDVTSITLEQKAYRKPNEVFEYNGVNPQNLGLLLQRASGKRYADLLSEKLWQYIAENDATVILDSERNRMPRTYCCLNATARDWLRIGILILNEGKMGQKQLIPKSWVNDMTASSQANPNYGYLTWLGNEHQKNRVYNPKSSATGHHSEPYDDRDIIYLDGFGGQRVYVIPSKGLVIVRTGATQMEWDDSVLPNILSRGIGK